MFKRYWAKLKIVFTNHWRITLPSAVVLLALVIFLVVSLLNRTDKTVQEQPKAAQNSAQKNQPQPKPQEPTNQPDKNQPQTYKKLIPGTTWQWQLTGKIDESILDKAANPQKMIDVDMELTDATTIARLKAKGITVICYIEVGAWEDYRKDAASFPEEIKGDPLSPPYDNERYLDIRSQTTQNLIVKRFDQAQQKGCDGIEPDIDDAYFEDFEGDYGQTGTLTGFEITYRQQLDYNIALAKAAHDRNMSYGLKNGANSKFVSDLQPHIDWVLSEECFENSSCAAYKPVIDANKAVFEVEYNLGTNQFCAQANALNFDAIKKATELNALPYASCR